MKIWLYVVVLALVSPAWVSAQSLDEGTCGETTEMAQALYQERDQTPLMLLVQDASIEGTGKSLYYDKARGDWTLLQLSGEEGDRACVAGRGDMLLPMQGMVQEMN